MSTVYAACQQYGGFTSLEDYDPLLLYVDLNFMDFYYLRKRIFSGDKEPHLLVCLPLILLIIK